jgi:hypothetical protein
MVVQPVKARAVDQTGRVQLLMGTKGIFLITTASRVALDYTQSRIPLVLVAVSPRMNIVDLVPALRTYDTLLHTVLYAFMAHR